jgi:hypothetical protein
MKLVKKKKKKNIILLRIGENPNICSVEMYKKRKAVRQYTVAHPPWTTEHYTQMIYIHDRYPLPSLKNPRGFFIHLKGKRAVTVFVDP